MCLFYRCIRFQREFVCPRILWCFSGDTRGLSVCNRLSRTAKVVWLCACIDGRTRHGSWWAEFENCRVQAWNLMRSTALAFYCVTSNFNKIGKFAFKSFNKTFWKIQQLIFWKEQSTRAYYDFFENSAKLNGHLISVFVIAYNELIKVFWSLSRSRS